MIRGSAAVAAGLAAVLGLAAPAQANICANVSFSPATPTIPAWDPINPIAQETTFTVTMTRIANASKAARLIFLDTNNSSNPVRIGTTGPRYEIVNLGNNTVVSFPTGTSVNAVTTPLTAFGNGANDSVNITMKLRIPANSLPVEEFTGGATFSETLRYSVLCYKNNDKDNGVDTAVTSNLTLSMTIPKLVSIVTAQPATIDFGNFTTTNQQAQITVKSTSSLNIAVATANGSKLVRSGAVAPYPANASIPYAMRFNDVAVAPGSPLVNETRAGVSGAMYPLRLTLTDGIPSGKLAGSYSDSITLTITPGQ